MASTNQSCLLCVSSPEEGMFMTGIKLIKNKEEPYALCKECCFSKKGFGSDEQKAFRQQLWENVEQKIKDRRKQEKINK